GSCHEMSRRCQGYVGQIGSAIPTRNVVTTDPRPSRITAAPTVSTAQRWIQRLGLRVDVPFSVVSCMMVYRHGDAVWLSVGHLGLRVVVLIGLRRGVFVGAA